MHPSRAEFRRIEFVLEDDTQRCLTAYLPDAMAQLVRGLKASENSALLSLSERQLIKQMVRAGKAPDSRDYTIKMRFWCEFERVQEESGAHPLSMNMALILGRAISKEAFYKHYATDPLQLAFILCPPENYAILLEQTLMRAMYRMAEYIDKTELNDDNILKAAKIIDEMHRRSMSFRVRLGRPKVDGEPGASSENSPLAELTPLEKAEALKARISEAKVIDE